MSKKLLSLMLALIMIFGAAPLSNIEDIANPFIQDAEAYRSGIFEYDVYDGKATITGVTRTDMEEIYIPAKIGRYPVEGVYPSAFEYCENLKSFNVDPKNKYLASKDGILFSKDLTGLIVFPRAKEVQDYIVPANVTSVGSFLRSNVTSVRFINEPVSISINCFESCPNLKYVEYPNGTEYVGSFSGSSSLENVYIAEGAISLIDWCFDNCDSLKEFVIPDNIDSIGDYTFSQCDNLKKVKVGGTSTFLPSHMFYFCSSLEEIYINKNISALGFHTLYGCDKLKTIYYEGTPEEWNKINIGDGNSQYIKSANIVYNYVTKNVVWDIDGVKLTKFYKVGDPIVAPEVPAKEGYVFKGWNAEIPSAMPNKNLRFTAVWEKASDKLEITTQPTDYVGKLNSTATFKVAVNKTDVTYQWYYSEDGVKWLKSGNETANSAIFKTELKPHRIGQKYRCEITDSKGNKVVSNEVTMNLPESTIKITSQPADFLGYPDDNASFTVGATGEKLTYRWYFSNDNGETWKMTYSDGFAAPTVKPILREYRSGQMFKCLITDVNGNTMWTEPATMALKHSKITINKQPESYIGAINDLASFTVDAQGENLKYDWYLSKNNGATWERTFNEGHYTNNLLVRLYAYRDNWQFKCVITSGGVETVETNAVTISKKPATVKLVEQPVNAGGLEGETVKFHVGATGNGLTYQWELSKDNGKTWGATSMEGAKTDTLSVAVKAYRDGWMYRCKVTDESGTHVYSNVATLKMGVAPKIINQPKNIEAKNGTNAIFTVEAQGAVSYQWQYSNNGGATWVNSGAQGNKTASITISAAPHRNGQMYRCVVTNEIASVATTPATLTVR